MRTQPVWLEVALNGPWTRARQPGIPVTGGELVEQAVACAGEGAAVVHLHAYDDAGSPREACELYADSASDVRTGLGICRDSGLVPSYAVYEPGFLRAGAAAGGRLATPAEVRAPT
ncbi:hypothetical protein DQ238_15330 [Geodermatophilus sp. TF02-6]|uniref:3-keto-5-aminohexanoate cleavage protein n=1 Tax=Geodermatophilus sp. TF02-6 TaxID=2250575 RepID=UPI000DE8A137|nr:3-keto-5-aminohexanoate cleavage protein [Geodermatophilus sp. TF02-6]RBY77263.1 hypothetical protein DQ238_15330 [Geodermatophilus sp. TF02-6]